ncbi:hypothetical protein AX16_010498 [Volvariella volvacea WC 439]|nr:hypothetical protein AX16_010498 [Volvariella volvacea WC 439]
MPDLPRRGSISPPPSPTHTRKRSLSPTQTFHPPLLPFPTSALVESVAGAAHYSGARVDPDSLLKHRHAGLDSPGRHTELHCEHERILNDLKELYSCRPNLEIFKRSWSHDATFEDPLSSCKGFGEYAAQWFALPVLFSASETLGTRVMSSTHVPNRLIYEQTQEYTLRWLGFKKVSTLSACVSNTGLPRISAFIPLLSWIWMTKRRLRG